MQHVLVGAYTYIWSFGFWVWKAGGFQTFEGLGLESRRKP